MKILVLEDNERLAHVIKGVLEKEGYSVDLFFDGEKALDALTDVTRRYVELLRKE